MNNVKPNLFIHCFSVPHHSKFLLLLTKKKKMSKIVQEHGWTAVPRSLEKLVASRKNPQPSKPITVESIALPDSPLVQQVLKYAEENLPIETFNHSMRVYYYGNNVAF